MNFKEPENKFVNRYAAAVKSREAIASQNSDNEFSAGYKKGRLSFAVANSRLAFKSCGLDRYVEASNNDIWKRDGDSIVRLENDTSWIDELLKLEGNE